MNYTKVDLTTWKRAKLFNFYTGKLPLILSLTVDIDVKPLIDFAKKNGYKFYPTMIWAVSKIVNSHDEFKYGRDGNGDLIKWDYMSPSYTVFHKEDECFTKYSTEYSDDIAVFHARYLEDLEKYKDLRGITDIKPPNIFDVSCLPWVKYSHVDLHVFDGGTFLPPIITWGKYEEAENGKKQDISKKY